MSLPVGIALGLCCLIFTTVAADGPTITLKPAGGKQNKALGGEYAFTCFVQSTGKDTVSSISWLDPYNRTIDANYRALNPRIYAQEFKGDRKALVFSKLLEQDDGIYTCVANVGSQVLTTTLDLGHYQGITFVDAPVDQFATIGLRHKIKCEVRSNPPPTIEWTRNNVRLETGPRYVLENDGLVINGVQESDDGEYKCEVIVLETGEVNSRDIRLEVTAAPKIVDTPEMQLVTEGEKATIVCKATGKPKPEIRWIKSSTKEVVSKGLDGILYIEKVTREDNTNYTCEAKNKAGEVSSNIHLSVRSKPEVIDVRNGTAKVGTFAQIQCFVYANPRPSVVIRKFESNRQTRQITSEPRSVNAVGPRTAIEVIDDPVRKHVFLAKMNFTSVERYDDGLYECLATNDVGQSSRSVHLTVETPPVFDPAVNVREIFSWNRIKRNLTCTAEAIPNATITWFFNNRKIEINERYRTLYGHGSPSTINVEPIDKTYYGTYTCEAVNKHGTARHNILFREAYPPSTVDKVEFNSTTATSITFRIVDPLNTGGLPIKGYVVQYKKDTDQWNEAKNETWARGAAYVLRDLSPSTRYIFRFSSFNDVGTSGWSQNQDMLMPDMSPPSEPIITNPVPEGAKYIQLETAKSFELRWNIPPSNGAEIDKYELKYCIVNGDQETFPEVADSCQTTELQNNEVLSSYKITGLNPDTFYKVELRARNNIGYGQASQRIFRTNNVDPIAPTTVSTEPVDKAEAGMSSAVIIYIVVAILLAFLVIVDIFCFFVGKTGVLYLLCGRCCGRKKKNSDDKLGRSHSTIMLVPTNYVTVMTLLSDSETKDLISNGHKKIDIEEQAPMITDGSKKDTAVEYDLKKGTARTGFVGKDSAV